MNHRNYERNEIEFRKNEIISRALITNEIPADIIKTRSNVNSVISESENIKIKGLNDLIHNKRDKENLFIVKDDIPENIKCTLANELFFLFDGGINSEDRFIIFTTLSYFDHLMHFKLWFCDRNFRYCPKKFSQLYVIIAELHGINVPQSKALNSKLF